MVNSESNSATFSYGAFRNRYKQVAVTGGNEVAEIVTRRGFGGYERLSLRTTDQFVVRKKVMTS